MKIACITAFSLLIATPTLAQQVTFTCVLTGSSNSGFDIRATNPSPNVKKCGATCTVTKSDGSTKSWFYSGMVYPNGPHWLGGETEVPGAPLSNPTISNTSCN